MAQPRSNLRIKQLPVASLVPYARNARTHSEAQVDQLKASIAEFGFTNPVLVDGDREIIAGHGRVLAALSLGMAKVPCIELGHLSEAQKRAYILADNKLAENAGWDEELLSIELGALQEIGFDLDLVGFSTDELDDLLPATADPEPVAEVATTAKDALHQFGGATAIHRGSVPLRYWREEEYLTGSVLDFGSGHDAHEFEKYDAFSDPDVAPLLDQWDTIMCNYVLCVQPSDHLIIQILALVRALLKPNGQALFSVRSDITESYDTSRGHQVAKTKDEWAELLREIFWVEPVEAKGFFGFVCRNATVDG